MKNKFLPPIKAVRKYCLWCTINQPKEIRLCPSTNCTFYKYRFGKGRPKIREIRDFCLGCSGDSMKEVRECEFTDCSLYPYRMGKSPNRKGIGNHQLNKQKTEEDSYRYKTIVKLSF